MSVTTVGEVLIDELTLRRRVEELISLPEYYAVEAATTERGSSAPTEHH